MTFEFIKENKNKVWSFHILSRNQFEKHPFFNYNNNYNTLTKSATKF